jgi:hypothetical protein
MRFVYNVMFFSGPHANINIREESYETALVIQIQQWNKENISICTVTNSSLFTTHI